MHSIRTLLTIARLPTSIASDHEAQRQHASFAKGRTSIPLPEPVCIRARRTAPPIPFGLTPTRSAVDSYFAITSNVSRDTSSSRHDQPPRPSTLPACAPAHEYPPLPLAGQEDEVDPQSYSAHIGPCIDGKPFLLAKFLFKYGFGQSFSSTAWTYESISFLYSLSPTVVVISTHSGLSPYPAT
jgi:hypothetical protein